MALVIPNIENITNGSVGLDFQSVPDATDWAAQAASESGAAYVVSGMTVTQDTGSDMKIAVAAGTFVVNGTTVQYAGTGGTPIVIGAASATDRRDIVSISSGGTVTVTAGTACGTAGWTRSSSGLPPVKPSIPANNCLLGEVGVTSSTTVITTAINVVDKTTVNNVRRRVGTPNTSSQSLTASLANLITGTSIALATSQLQVGSIFKFTMTLTKTAAGTATWKADVKFGTANTTSDATIATFTSGTNTAVATIMLVEIYATVTALGSGTSATATCFAVCGGGGSLATGLASIGPAPGSTAGFNSTATNPFFHIDITPGASAVMTGWGMAEQLY